MRARQRHFNARDAGAGLVLDSRYIDQADNTAVSSWTDRSANNFTIEQTTSGNRPTFQTAELASNGVVRFDGSDDFLNGGDILDLRTNNLIMICVAKIASGSNATLAAKSRAAAGSGRYFLLKESGTMYATVVLASQTNAGISDSSTAWRINTNATDRNGSVQLYFNGTSQATGAFSANTTDYDTTDSFLIGAYPSSTGGTPPTAGLYLNGDIAQIIVLLPSVFSNSLRRRLEQSAAYSFKIACS